MGALDRCVRAFEQAERLSVERLGLIASTAVPQESADLALDAGRRGMIARVLIGAQHRAVMFLRGLASADWTAQIGDALADHELLVLLLVGRPQGGKRLLVVADGIDIGISRSGPIARSTQEACAFRFLLAQAEMVA